MNTASLSARVKRLLTANVHSLIGSLEERAPQALLEQYLREFDEVIDQTRVELGQYEAAKHQATRAIARLNNDIERLTDQISIALEQDDETAARAGAEKQLDLESQIDKLNGGLQDSISRANATEGDLLELRVKREEMELALQELIAAQTVTGREEGNVSSPGAQNKSRAEQLERGFDRTLAKTSGMSGLTGSSSADPRQLKKLEVMQREQRITDRLERLKAERKDRE